MARPRSTYSPVDSAPYGLPYDQHRHLQPIYPGLDSNSYGVRRPPPMSTPYSNMSNSDRYASNAPGQYSTGYPYPRPSQPHHTGPANNLQPTGPTEPRCEWHSEHCGMTLEDSSPAGIARHLRQHHNVVVTDNRNRGVCVWGGRCGKDMFPSSFGKHIAECHLRNMTKQCQYCGADFARADTLSRHIKAFCPNTVGARGHSSG